MMRRAVPCHAVLWYTGACTIAYMRTCVHEYMRTCVHAYMHARMCIYVCMHIYIYIYICIYTHTYTYTYTYTYTHVYMYQFKRGARELPSGDDFAGHQGSQGDMAGGPVGRAADLRCATVRRPAKISTISKQTQ